MALSGCIESLSIQNGEEGHVYDLIAPESADIIEAEAISMLFQFIQLFPDELFSIVYFSYNEFFPINKVNCVTWVIKYSVFYV